jgi:hypothetical protein
LHRGARAGTIGVVWRKPDPAPELVELIAALQELGSFLMGMDAKLELIELLGGENGEEGNRADS